MKKNLQYRELIEDGECSDVLGGPLIRSPHDVEKSYCLG